MESTAQVATPPPREAGPCITLTLSKDELGLIRDALANSIKSNTLFARNLRQSHLNLKDEDSAGDRDRFNDAFRDLNGAIGARLAALIDLQENFSRTEQVTLWSTRKSLPGKDAKSIPVHFAPGSGTHRRLNTEAADTHAAYVPAAHNGREGDLMSEGDRSCSPTRGHVGDLVGSRLDVTG